ncbi:MAG: hypothetical protein HFG49_07310 [Lachnospiraceae bacterium]|jgi:hypothetical protein|nr:hypothetical protein [Lachnospiraceae bacterium]
MLLANTTNSVSSANFPEWLPPLIIIPVMVLIVLMIRKSRKRAKANRESIRQSGILSYTAFHHVDGLQIPENTLCEIKSFSDRIEFKAGTTSIKLSREKITDMSIKTDVEIQKQTVSSVGGAIAGSVMFGTLGAIIGGRAKNKKVKTTTQYLIITYTGEQGDLKYIGFDIKNNPPSASKLVKEFRELNTNSGVQIEL